MSLPANAKEPVWAPSRRGLIASATLTLAASALKPVRANPSQSPQTQARAHALPRKGAAMNSATARDHARIFYKDWGHGQPVAFAKA